MEAKTIKGGTLRLLPVTEVMYQMGYFFHFAEPENGVKSFRKVYFGNELLNIIKVNPEMDYPTVYPAIKFGYDFISQMQGTPTSQCQKATEYLLHPMLIESDWKQILKNDKAILTSILSPIEDFATKQVSWYISSIQWT